MVDYVLGYSGSLSSKRRFYAKLKPLLSYDADVSKKSGTIVLSGCKVYDSVWSLRVEEEPPHWDLTESRFGNGECSFMGRVTVDSLVGFLR